MDWNADLWKPLIQEREFLPWLVRVPLILLVAAYVLVPLYFTLQLGGA